MTPNNVGNSFYRIRTEREAEELIKFVDLLRGIRMARLRPTQWGHEYVVELRLLLDSPHICGALQFLSHAAELYRLTGINRGP